MKLRPLSNNLIVRRADAAETSPGGIILAASAQKKPGRGTVIAAGPGYHTDAGVFVASDCKPGDIIVFPDQVGHEITVDGEPLLVISEDAVIAIAEVA